MTTAVDPGYKTLDQVAAIFRDRRALVLEDEIGEDVRQLLLKAGFAQADVAITGEEALERMEETAYDLVILDRINPGMEGLDVLDRVRAGTHGLATGKDVPVLVYSLLGDEAQRIHGLIERGADDYIPKPASHEELVARIAVQLRRQDHATLDDGWSCEPLEVFPDSKVVTINGRKVSLTTRETDILVQLYKERGNPLSQSMLWDRCWIGHGWSHYPEEFANTVDQAIKRLRRSLKKQCPEVPDSFHPLVVNIWAQGFALRNLTGMSADPVSSEG